MMTKIDKPIVSSTEAKKLISNHEKLTHSENLKVSSHVQREKGEWIVNTLMFDNIDVPFKYKRKKLYKSLKGLHVNLTYYPAQEIIAGFSIEVMNVIRIKVS
jgi:hypothetical protein